jgi:rubredoxin
MARTVWNTDKKAPCPRCIAFITQEAAAEGYDSIDGYEVPMARRLIGTQICGTTDYSSDEPPDYYWDDCDGDWYCDECGVGRGWNRTTNRFTPEEAAQMEAVAVEDSEPSRDDD